ncbi:sel1 repeat family protein [Rhizobium leguminosarum]|uniref:tetratricopeptide repeat protein n=1 Tax=Rhizobium leguminosarum TaxID=384 RepID=UPI001C93EDDF|nr:tetratricopeptide repeat protein [Rhizobium leguminosarum]MBY5918471.1 sel1 repeat family protein [Rhizobium leguminosarum]
MPQAAFHTIALMMLAIGQLPAATYAQEPPPSREPEPAVIEADPSDRTVAWERAVATDDNCEGMAANPNDPQKPANIRGTYFVRDGAVEACLAALGKRPDDARILYQVARAYGEADRWNDALPYLEKAIKRGSAAALALDAETYLGNCGDRKPDYAKAKSEAEQAAAQGASDGLVVLGIIYRNARGVAEDPAMALKLFKQGVDAKNATAAIELGRVYNWGLGVPSDANAAYGWYKKAVEMSNGGIGYESIGRLYGGFQPLLGENNEVATKMYVKAFEAGDQQSAIWIGYNYLLARGVPNDDDMAVRMFEAAGHKGYVTLGQHYAMGFEGKKDPPRAREWFQKAANNGSVEGMVALGESYRLSDPPFRDVPMGIVWISKAADSGDTKEMVKLGRIYKDGEGIEKDYASAEKWFSRAAAAGKGEGMAGMGFLATKKSPPDHRAAVDWYQKSIDRGYKPAAEQLGDLYRDGLGVKKSVKKAVELYQRAETPSSLVALGRLYATGTGVPKNTKMAIMNYISAAEGRNGFGYYEIARAMIAGDVVKRDETAAAALLYKAIKGEGNAYETVKRDWDAAPVKIRIGLKQRLGDYGPKLDYAPDLKDPSLDEPTAAVIDELHFLGPDWRRVGL